MEWHEQITQEIAEAILAALGSSDDPTERMLEVVKNLDKVGYKIVPKD